MGNRELDVIIFGASGFTGEYVVEDLSKYLSKVGTKPIRWAVAGRSESKLRSVLELVAVRTGRDFSSIQVILADVNDEVSMDSMTRRCKVLLNCTGPFRYFGEAVVQSCLRSGCHYLDITGEPQFMESVQLKYHEEAKEKGLYIIPGCGFDSIPGDVGTDWTKDQFNADGSVLDQVQAYISTSGPLTANNTTWTCAVDGICHVDDLKKIRKRLFETIYSDVSKVRPKFPIGRTFLSKYSNDLVTGLAIEFPGADRSVVKRSQMSNVIEWKEEHMVQFEAYIVQSYLTSFLFLLMALIMSFLIKFQSGSDLLKKYPSFFTLGFFKEGGPSKDEVDHGTFAITFHGLGWPANANQDQPPTKSILTRLSGPHAGYPTCSICLNQSAIVLLEELHKLPNRGGSYTPSTAFRKTTLVHRLQENGLKFQVL